MAQDPNDLDKLYKAVSSQFDIGSEDAFKKRMQNAEDRKKFYNAVSDNGYDLGDYDAYEARLGKQNGVSGQGSLNTSGQSVEPITTQNQQTEVLEMPTGDLSNPSSESEIAFDGSEIAKGGRYDAATDTLYKELDEVSVFGEDKQDKGFFADAYNSIAAGSATLGASFAAIPEFLYNLAAVPQNLAADLTGIDALRSDYDAVSQGAINPLNILSKADKYYRDLSEDYSARVTEFDRNITNSLGKGSFGDAGRQIVNGILQSAPSIMGMMVTGGAGQAAKLGILGRNALSALPFAGSNFQEIQDSDIPQSLKPIVSGLRGLSEVVFEQSFGTVKLIEQIRSKAMGKEAVKEFVEGYMNKLLSSTGIPAAAFRGAVSEAATELSNNMIDRYSGIDPDRDLWENVSDAAIIGAVMDSGISTGATISNKIIDSKSKKRTKDLESQIQTLKSDLDGATDEAAQIIQEAIESRANEISEIIDTDASEYKTMKDASKKKIQEIDARIGDIESSIENSELGEATVQVLREEVTKLEGERESIIEERTSEIDQAVAEFNEKNPDVEVDLFEDLPDLVVKTFDRVESGLPTDPVALQEASDWLYQKHKDILAEKNNPERRHTIEQIDQIAEQLGEDITLLENYKYEQTGETQEAQPERKVDIVADETQAREAEGEVVAQEVEITEEVEVAEEVAPIEAVQEVVEPAVVEEAPTQETEAPVEPKEPRVNVKEDDAVIAERNLEKEREERKARQAPVRPMSEFSNQDEYSRYIAENSNDPIEVAKEYKNTAPAEPDYIESQIAEYLGNSKINESDFVRYGDRSNLDGNKRKRWIDSSNKGIALDVAAQELSDMIGVEVTPNEFVDFITEYSGIEAFSKSAKSDTQIALESKYKELTGRNLTPEISEAAQQEFNNTLTDKDIFETNTDLKELGITYDDILNYEEYNRSAIERTAESVPESKNDQSTSKEVVGENKETQAESRPTKIKPKPAVVENKSESTTDTPNVKEPTSDTIGVKDAFDYDKPEANKYRPEEQLKFNQGEYFMPVHLVSKDSELMELIAIGAKVRQKFKGKKVSINTERRKELEGKYGIDAVKANQQARAIAKEQRSETESTIVELLPPKRQEKSTKVQEQEKVAEEKLPEQKKAKPKIPKELMKGVVKKLLESGLAKDITITNTEGVNANLGRTDGRNINGYVDADGNVFINEDAANLSTPIHELSHLWESAVEKENPVLHAKGMELIRGEEGKPYVDYVKRTQPSLEGDALHKEALSQAIGDNGAELILKHKEGRIRDWIKDVWEWIGSQVGISKKTPEQIANMNLKEFSDAVAIDLLSGQPIVSMPNGDIVMKIDATKETVTTEQQKVLDFLERMRKKNGIQYQGNINAQSLSNQDLADFIEFIQISKADGSINNKAELTKIANSIGITNPSDIDTAWNMANQKAPEANQNEAEGVGIKKNLVGIDRLLEIDYKGLTDAEYIEQGKRMVDAGIVKPNDLVQDIILSPRALQPWEVTALVYHRANVQNDLVSVMDVVEKGGKELDSYEYQGLKGKGAAQVRLNVIAESIRDFETVMVSTANQQSSAFRLRSLMTDKDHNIVSFLASSRASGMYIAPEVVTRMKEMAKELDQVKAKLAKKAAKADVEQAKISEGNIEQSANKPVKKTRVVNTVKQKDAFNAAVAHLNLNDFALPNVKFQANNTVRFQTQATATLSEAINEAVVAMQESVNTNQQTVSDAIESAIDAIDAKVGKGKWNEIAFRSAMVNSMAEQGNTIKVKKPYVASDGTLVVPGQYITSLAKNGVKGLDALVDAVKSEVGNQYSDYQVRNAISGYGRVAVKTATETQTEINRAKRIARLLSSIEDLEVKGERAKNPKKAFTIDREIEGLINQVKALEYGLEMTPEERAQAKEAKTNETRRKYLENYVAELQQRTKDGDFAPRHHVTKYVKDAETLALEVEAEKIRNEFKKAKYEAELANRSFKEKAGDLAFELIFNSTRALSAGADLSAIGVQGALFVASNPVKAAKVFKEGWKRSFDEASYEAYFAELQSDPYYEIARKAGLNLQLPSFYQSVQEEQYKGAVPTIVWDGVISRPVGKLGKMMGFDEARTKTKTSDVNPYQIADRNYSVVLSKIRFDMFKDFMNNQIVKQGIDLELDVGTIKEVADAVNTLTMASKVPFGSSQIGNRAMSIIFFSARKLMSTWKIFLDVFPPTGAVRGYTRFKANPTLAKDYYSNLLSGMGRLSALTIAPALIAYLNYDDGDDEEVPETYNPHVMNPLHSDFMKIRVGNTRISLFQGIDGNVVFATRLAMNEMMTSSSSKVRTLGASGEKTRRDLGVDYFSNKFAPTLSAFNKYYLGSDRESYEGADRFKESFFPMWATGAVQHYDDTGSVMETGFLGVMGVTGLAYNNYGGAEFAGTKGTNDRKAKAIVENTGLSVYNPSQGDRFAYDGKERAAVKGERYQKVYKPAYEEFMTSAVKANEDNFAKSIHWEKKEGLINNLKRQAYKYAEIKTSGVYMDSNFSKLTQKGKPVVLAKSDYPVKVDLIKEFTESPRAEGMRLRERRKIERQATKEGLKPNEEYINMKLDVHIYNEANKAANKKLLRLSRMGDISLIPSGEYIKSEDIPE